MHFLNLIVLAALTFSASGRALPIAANINGRNTVALRSPNAEDSTLYQKRNLDTVVPSSPDWKRDTSSEVLPLSPESPDWRRQADLTPAGPDW